MNASIPFVVLARVKGQSRRCMHLTFRPIQNNLFTATMSEMEVGLLSTCYYALCQYLISALTLF